MKSKLGFAALACAALSGCTHRVAPADPGPAPVTETPAPISVEPMRPAEACNAIDDNGNGSVDEGQTCGAICSKAAVAIANASVRMPREGDHTVPTDSEETPTLLAINAVPAFCSDATPPSTADDVTVACGDILDVGSGGISANTLRVAPGGVVRFKADAVLDIHDEILVCPGAMIQSGHGLALHGDGESGSSIDLRTERLIMLGKIETRGGWVPTESGHPGDSGALAIAVERLLFSGVIDTAATPPRGYRSGEPGGVTILATKESFFTGYVRSGNAFIKMPVCCAE
jgi:hypothetical protein